MDLVKAQVQVAGAGQLEGERPDELATPLRRGSTPKTRTAISPLRRAGSSCSTCLRAGGWVDTAFSEGDLIPADFDSMIAKIIATAALATRLCSAPSCPRRHHGDHRGRTTNKSSCSTCSTNRDHLTAAPIPAGSTGRTTGRLVAEQHAGVALVAAAIEAYQDKRKRTTAFPRDRARRPSPSRHEPGRAIDLKLRGMTHRVTVAQLGPRDSRWGSGRTATAARSMWTSSAWIAFASRLEIGDQRLQADQRHIWPGQPDRGDGTSHRVPATRAVYCVRRASVGWWPSRSQSGRGRAGAPVLILER